MDASRHVRATDPLAGIGPDIIAKGYCALGKTANPLVIGETDINEVTCVICGLDLKNKRVGSSAEAFFGTDAILVLNLVNVDELERGVVHEEYGKPSLEYVDQAIALAQSGAIDAIITASINKQSMKLADSDYAGHTRILADHTGTESCSMMLIESDLRVIHVSTNVSLREACALVGEDSIRMTDEALHKLELNSPKVAVAGLNPHKSMAERLHEMMLNSRLATLEGYGHAVHLVAPDRYTDEVLSFISEVD